jgi:DNA mismatch repair ATPase MutS
LRPKARKASFVLTQLLRCAMTCCGTVCSILQSWLKAPLVEPAAIRQRLDIVDAMVADQGLREGVRDALRGTP